MSEQYSHLLIARDVGFVPATSHVCRFLVKLTELGVLSPKPDLVLRTPSSTFREGVNPFTGEVMRIPRKDVRPVADLAAYESAAKQLSDYEIEASSEWNPRLPPLPIEFTEQYFIGVTSTISSVPRSTSHYVPESEPVLNVVDFGEPCENRPTFGVFTNPHDLSIIQVPDAGAARFWIQFELGKFLFPMLPNGSLDILASEIVESAEQIFGVGFNQGCYWG
jgi:hypothetical protein